jgi:hypothetical protein
VRLGPLPRHGLTVSALALIPAPAAAQGLPVATPQEIVAGAGSCAAATSAGGVDEHKLQADGWRAATMSANGRPVDTLRFYSKGSLLLTLPKDTAKICIFTARIRDAATFGDIASVMDTGLNVSGTARQGEANTVYWFPSGHVVQMQLTGKPDSPSVRVGVGYMAAEKK